MGERPARPARGEKAAPGPEAQEREPVVTSEVSGAEATPPPARPPRGGKTVPAPAPEAQEPVESSEAEATPSPAPETGASESE